MATTAVTRDYNFSDARLVQLCDDIAGSVERDLTEFGNFNVTQTTLDALNDARDDFDDMQTDGELLGEISIATENKNAKRDELMGSLKIVRTIAENKWGTASAYYRQFGFDGMLQLSDDKLLRLAKKVHRVATARLSDLEGEGLDAAKTTQLETQRSAFDDLVDLKEEAIENRDLKTQERRLAGNKLYKEIVRLANIGKTLFEQSNEAKYNDYIIYNTSTAHDATTPDTTLGVTVTDANTGATIAGADVHIVELELTITTGANGIAPFNALDPGSYNLQVIAPGYEINNAATEVAAGQANALTVALTPE